MNGAETFLSPSQFGITVTFQSFAKGNSSVISLTDQRLSFSRFGGRTLGAKFAEEASRFSLCQASCSPERDGLPSLSPLSR